LENKITTKKGKLPKKELTVEVIKPPSEKALKFMVDFVYQLAIEGRINYEGAIDEKR
jgi:hypothetical protein